jgi:hypothetical protein
MKNKNPLHYDLSRLPESAFTRRGLSRYKKKILRKRTIKKYLPTLELYAWTEEVFLEALGYPSMDWLKYGADLDSEDLAVPGIQAMEFAKYFRDLGKRSDWTQRLENLIESLGGDCCCVYILPRTDELEQFTPFMMLHDLMEEIQFLGAEGEYPLNVEDEMSKMSYGIISIPKPTTLLKFTPFVPKLQHTHPDYEARYMARSEYELDRQELRKGYHFVDYSLNFKGNGDLVSDLWALWCVKEKLTPKNFYPPQMVVDELAKEFKLDKSRMSWNSVTLEDYCGSLNQLFSQVLEAIRGSLIGV